MAEQQPKYVTVNGRTMTYTRWKYEETLRQQQTLAQVNDLITAQATTLANVGAGFGQQEFGGYLRSIIPNLLDTYGNVNAQAAMNYYDQARKQWFDQFGMAASREVSRSSVRAREKRFAAAKTAGAYRVGTMDPAEFEAKFLPTYKTLEKTDTVVNFAMKVRAKSGHAPSVSAMNNALTREVASYHRDTVLFNSALDPYATRVQRVAQFGACEFCKLMALGSTSGKVRVSTYAVKFHSHCHCTIQTLWEGDEPVRPDYYDQFEEEYVAAAGSGRSAKETLEQWRKNTKTATVAAAPKAKAPSSNLDFDVLTTPKDVQELLNSKYSGRMTVEGLSNRNLNLDSVKEVAKTIDNLLTEYPGVNLTSVKVKNIRAIAQVASRRNPANPSERHHSSIMEISVNNLRDRDGLNAIFTRSVEAGHFHDRPANVSPMEYAITHEFGHLLDFSIQEQINPFAIRDAFLVEKTGSAISKEAAAFRKTQISGYGLSNRWELLAEAFADVRVNGDNAKELSTQLVKELLSKVGKQ